VPAKKPSLHIFDFDDTLFTTDNTVGILIPGRGRIELDSYDYGQLEKNHELPSKGISKEDVKNAQFFFDNFEEVKNPRPIRKNLAIFGNILLHSPDNLFILTARGSGSNKGDIKNIIDDYFGPILPETGFDIGHIITRDEQQHYLGDTAEKKKQAIEDLQDFKGIEKVHFVDDAPKNVEKVKEIPGARARLVKHPREEEFKNTENQFKGASKKMPRENVPQRVDEIADSIVERMKKDKKKISKEKMYDIAYGTAWKTYYKENSKAKKNREKKSEEILSNLRMAEVLDSLNYYDLADLFQEL
jgi:hypothetical protein